MDFNRGNNESYKDYGNRLYKNKSLYGLKIDDVAELLNEEFPEKKKGESAHRKYFAPYGEGFDDGYEKALNDHDLRECSTIIGLSTLIPKTHLERMQDLIGEYNIKKRDSQLERNELAKLYREATPAVLLTEAYSETLKNMHSKHLPEFRFKPKVEGGKSVIKAIPADWHVGAMIDEEYNFYNYNTAIKRLDLYCNKLMEYAEIFNAKTISITNLGDIIEGFEMRNPQKWDCELTSDKQIVFAEELMWRMCETLMDGGYNIELSGVYGNHDRMTGNKNDSVENNTAMYVIMQNMKNEVKRCERMYDKKLERLLFMDQPEDYEYHIDNFFGKKIRYQHGHNDAKADERKIEKYNGVDNDFYDMLVFGHLHHGRVLHKNREEIEVYAGSLQGSNQYGKNKVKSVANASQGIIVFKEDGDIIPFEVNLQNA